jgi:putative colanic acid biosynthesis UDP-glucose lipid carrier transferase
VVIIGDQKNTAELAHFFEDNPDYGYRLKHNFNTEENKKSKIQECLEFIVEQKIDEIYCSLEDLTNTEVNDLIDFSDSNLKTLKFLPNKKEATSRNLKYDYYGYIPIVSLRNIPQDLWINKLIKRSFDVLFSLIIIFFLLSWLVPIMALLIKLESKGPVFFKQGRPGYNEKEFFCYKFRSMRINNTTEKEASKGDPRVTKTGRFIRKTSMDELPQFLNVLKGEMSVVGPRPHLWSQNKSYANKIKKYMVRHYVKPGITGLAQVRGFRGEIETDKDMINRINLDVYYIENWSLIMDIKIIFQTVINIFKGEEKAY